MAQHKEAQTQALGDELHAEVEEKRNKVQALNSEIGKYFNYSQQ